MKKLITFLLALSILLSQSFVNINKSYGVNEKLIFSDSFENGIDDYLWTHYNNTPGSSVSCSESFDKDKSIYIEDRSTTATYGISSPLIAVKSGYSYRSEAYLNVDATNIKLYFRFYDTNNKQIFSKSTNPSKKNQWCQVTSIYDAPENACYAQLIFCGVVNATGNGYVDKVALYEISKEEDYKQRERVSFIIPDVKGKQNAKIIEPNGKKLIYNSYDNKGNTLADFSYAGFYEGEYEIPASDKLKLYATLSPSGAESDNGMIQAAINNAAKSVKTDEMAVVKLKAGRYNIDSTGISLKTGVVLSGEGQGPTGTVLYAKDHEAYEVISIKGSKPVAVGSGTGVTTSYIKSGSKSFSVENASTFKAGDTIRIQHKATKEWDKELELSTMTYHDPNDGLTYDTSWEDKFVVNTERIIEKIEGNTITVNFPFFIHYDNNVTPLTVYKLNDAGRIKNAGVENLRILSYFDPNITKNGYYTDDNHANYGVCFASAKDCFAQNVTVKHIKFSAFYCHEYSKRITIRNCSAIEPVSTIAGSERYSFGCTRNTQQILITGCYSHAGRHDFETSYTATGPYAFVDNLVDGSFAASETHGTWSTGVLYDNLLHIGAGTAGFISVANRGSYGSRTSQGWSGAGAVIWNSLSSSVIAHKPTGDYQNFLVGIYGLYTDSSSQSKKNKNINDYKGIYKTDTYSTGAALHFATSGKTSFIGDCYKESEELAVNPQSIFKAQLAERITGDFNNAKPTLPVISKPAYDEAVSINYVTISGFCNPDTDRVTVYVDDIPYEADINESFKYEATVNLKNGTHKIYAIRTVNGVDSNKTADRFITVVNDSENCEYLESKYKSSALSLIVKDERDVFAATEIAPEFYNPSFNKKDDCYEFNIEIKKFDAKSEACIIAISAYDMNGKYIDGGFGKVSYGIKYDSGVVTINTKEEIKSIKAMLWEGKKTLKPFCQPQVFNIN